jgi:CheY-specific phosphatase CheX
VTVIDPGAFLATVANALERMAFVVVEPSGDTPAAVLAGSTYHAVIGLQHDDGHGVVMVAATDGFLQEFIAGMLGLEQEAIDLGDHGAGAVMELANVLGGEAVMAVGGAESPLRLGLPECLDAAASGELLRRVAREAGYFACALASEGGRILVAGSLR